MKSGFFIDIFLCLTAQSLCITHAEALCIYINYPFRSLFFRRAATRSDAITLHAVLH